MNKKLIIALPLISAVMFSGCATLFGGGGKQTLSINSDKPMPITIAYADGSSPQYVTTPATISVERRNRDIKISSNAGEFQPVTVKKSVNGWVVANILGGFASILSTTTDAASGALWKYDDAVNIHSNGGVQSNTEISY
ncbi:hypothetical protein [Candidatus Sulfurimonas baltica]|uniref:Translation initiation factor 2 n=1 Tax=Candidatus Sulfurimonas baltica TaxID=2740404 RepID=A0A7S7RNX7_9BACT|nr:hypothetical protein [Candidatus Sulfurimonas baltica]QOY53009.1 hypothetical protein HUE88_04820 [Candidatus Sulfurimonas baltica]